MKRSIHPGRTGYLVFALCLSFSTAPARAQGDEATAEDEDAVEVERFELPESAFESWVFRHGQSATSVRTQLEKNLELFLDDVDRACDLTVPQRQKVRLAGRGDIKEYFNEVELLRRRFLLLRRDRDKFNEIWKEMRPLQVKLANGLFEPDSLARQVLRQQLSAEQAARFEQHDRERRAFRHQAEIEWVIAMLDNVLPLGDEQRQGLTRLLLEKTRWPRRSGEQDHYVVLWQASRLPDDDLKAWLDEGQWKVLQQQFAQLKGIESYLRENGRLELEGDPLPESDQARSPPSGKN